MAKIYISASDNLKGLQDVISNALRKNSGHRPAIYQDHSDFTLELSQDWAGGDKNPSLYTFDNNQQMIDIGKSISDTFNQDKIYASYPKKKNEARQHPTILFYAGRINSDFDESIWGQLIARGIIKYFNPEYIQQSKDEKEPTVKRSSDKSYYDRSFNNNSTSNASLLFKKN
jgi:hypothetical protein